MGHADGSDEVCVRILSYVYETLLAVAQELGVLVALEKDETVQNTRRLVRVFREATGLSGGISLSVLGGVSAGRSASLNNPSAARPSILVVQMLQG